MGLPCVYLYLSGIGQFYSIVSLVKDLIYPLAYFFGLVAYHRTINKKNNIVFFIIITYIIMFTVISNNNVMKYLIDNNSIQTLFFSDFFLLYLIALPAFFMAKGKLDFDSLVEELYIIGIVIVFLFEITFFLLVFVYKVSFDYMNVAYGVIPWMFFVCGYSIFNKDRKGMLLSLISMCFIIISGCRGATVTTLLFCILLYISTFKNNVTTKKIVVFCIFSLFLIVILGNLDKVVSSVYFNLKNIGFTSRTLEMYLGLGYENGLNHYSDRAVLQEPLIKNFNLFGHGIYSDRELLNGVYAHNVLIEWIYDFGIFGGGIICAFFIINIICKCKDLIITDNKSSKIIFASCVSVMICKYMFSSSYLHAPEFWFLLGLLLNKNMYFGNLIKQNFHVERV